MLFFNPQQPQHRITLWSLTTTTDLTVQVMPTTMFIPTLNTLMMKKRKTMMTATTTTTGRAKGRPMTRLPLLQAYGSRGGQIKGGAGGMKTTLSSSMLGRLPKVEPSGTHFVMGW